MLFYIFFSDCTAPFAVGVVTDNMADAKSAMVSNRGKAINKVKVDPKFNI